MLQEAVEGMVTVRVFFPLCMVLAVEPAGNPSARIGCVVDQTGLLTIAGVQLVPDMALGSGSAVSVWPELGPCASETRNQPGCAMVTVMGIVTCWPG